VVASQTPDPAAGGEIAVRLFSGERPARIEIVGVDGEARVLDAHEPGTEFESTSGVTIRLPDGGTRQIDYPITVSVLGDSLRILVRLPVEDYVAAVLAGEAGGFRSGESLKAMAVAIRTYAAHFSDRHEGEGFDLCDTTHCQDFRLTAIESRFEEAARDTSGEVLLYGGQPIPAYYHQDYGGPSRRYATRRSGSVTPASVRNGPRRSGGSLGLSGSNVTRRPPPGRRRPVPDQGRR
jgi:hypothetical protein